MFDNYIKTGWTVSLVNLEIDNYLPRLIVRVATGRKYWPLFSEIINIDLGINDIALINIERQLYGYTFPMINRFVLELEEVLSFIYKVKIKLNKPV